MNFRRPGHDARWFSGLSGAAAIAAALAFLAALKAPDALAGLLTSAWNLLLLPGLIVLWRWLRAEHPRTADAAAAAGIASILLWAGAPLVGWWRLEPLWIALGAGWWLGVGLSVRRRWKWFGGASLALAGAAVLALGVALAQAAGPVGEAWVFLGALRLPLMGLWSLWLGVLLIARPVSA